MMAMQLLQQLGQPGMQQQELDQRQQGLDQNRRNDNRQYQQAQQQFEFNNQRQGQMQNLGVLEALTGVSRDPLTGGADPRLVLEFLKQHMGINVPQPAVPAGPGSFFQQQTK